MQPCNATSNCYLCLQYIILHHNQYITEFQMQSDNVYLTMKICSQIDS
jgi:hypothetical protein